MTKQENILRLQNEILQFESLIQEAINEGFDTSVYISVIDKLEVELFNLENITNN